MNQLNEYIMTEQDIKNWLSSWDGQWASMPEAVHRYVLQVETNNLKILSELNESLKIK